MGSMQSNSLRDFEDSVAFVFFSGSFIFPLPHYPFGYSKEGRQIQEHEGAIEKPFAGILFWTYARKQIRMPEA